MTTNNWPPPSLKTTRRPRSCSGWPGQNGDHLDGNLEPAAGLLPGPPRLHRRTPASRPRHLAGLTIAVAVGSKTQRVDALAAEAMVTVINRENVPWLVRHLGKAWPFDMVVIDELSSFKNHRAQRFKALASVRPRLTRIVGLTGTPAANGLMDLWAQFRLLDEASASAGSSPTTATAGSYPIGETASRSSPTSPHPVPRTRSTRRSATSPCRCAPPTTCACPS